MAVTQIRGNTAIMAATIDQSRLNLADPSAAQDAVTLNYLRNFGAGKRIKAPVMCMLLAGDFTFSSFAANVMTTTGNVTTADGYTLIVGDRVGISTLSGGNAKYNGIYTVTTLSGTSQFTRATDSNTSGTTNPTDLTPGVIFNVISGNTLAHTTWEMGLISAGVETFVLNTDAVNLYDMTPIVPTVPTFVRRETPSGTVNGSNPTFTLAHTPTTGMEEIFLNGSLLDAGAGNDYTISGNTLTMLTTAIPQGTDKLRASYHY